MVATLPEDMRTIGPIPADAISGLGGYSLAAGNEDSCHGSRNLKVRLQIVRPDYDVPRVRFGRSVNIAGIDWHATPTTVGC
jgi:hypothetical protein